MLQSTPNVVLNFHAGDQESAGHLLDLLLRVDDGIEARYFLHYGDALNTLRIHEVLDTFRASRNAALVIDWPDIVPTRTVVEDDPNLADYPGPHTKRFRAWKKRFFNWNLCVYNSIQTLDHFQMVEPDCVVLKDGWIREIFEGFRASSLPIFGHLKTGVIGGQPMPTHWAGCSYYDGKALRDLDLKRWFSERYDNPWWPLRLEKGSKTAGNCFWGPAFSGYDVTYDYFLYALYWKERTGSNDPRDWPADMRASREDLILCDFQSKRTAVEILDAHFGRLPLLHGVKSDDARILAKRKFALRRHFTPELSGTAGFADPRAPGEHVPRLDIEDLKGMFAGERVVLIGNGPSLNDTNLALLKDQYTIGLNRIYLIFESLGYQTTFFACVNKNIFDQFAKDFETVDSVKFMSDYARGRVALGPRDFLMSRIPRIGFNKDLRNLAWNEGWTVTYCGMQLAYYLGFSEVVLVGVDHYFVNSGEANKLVTETRRDENHFHPHYFGPGVKWQYPDLKRSEESYRMAKKVFEKAGRRVVDCTVGGQLAVFPKGVLEEVLAGPVHEAARPASLNVERRSRSLVSIINTALRGLAARRVGRASADCSGSMVTAKSPATELRPFNRQGTKP